MDKMYVNWSPHNNADSIERQLERFQRYLQNLGLRPSAIEMHTFRVGKYLRFARRTNPTANVFELFRDNLLKRKLKRIQ